MPWWVNVLITGATILILRAAVEYGRWLERRKRPRFEMTATRIGNNTRRSAVTIGDHRYEINGSTEAHAFLEGAETMERIINGGH